MNIADISESWLQQQQFSLQKGLTIEGTYLKELTPIIDGRGDVTELWSSTWVDGKNVVEAKHTYQSATDYGVVKCWHLHEKHTDQFTVTRGKLQVSMVDLRQDSSTYLHVNKVFLGTLRPRFLKIPPGVMHGWKALTQPEVLVVNFQSEPYDAADEFKFSWDCVLNEIWEPIDG